MIYDVLFLLKAYMYWNTHETCVKLAGMSCIGTRMKHVLD